MWPVAKAGGYLSVDDFIDCVDAVRSLRIDDQPFDACFIDRSPAGGDAETSEKIARLAAGGMTWWIDSLDDPSIPFEQHLARVHAGPPP